MARLVRVAISNHHVHLTEEIYNKIFTSPLTKRNDLNQIGEFASNQTVTIKTDGGILENVRIVGPFRDYNQVELTMTDAYKLKINPPVRSSGDLNNSETVTIIGDKGSITLSNCCIIANRHVHMNIKEAKSLGISNNQPIKILVNKEKQTILFGVIKVSDNGYFELHLDTDDANACGLKNGNEVEFYL